ncbi:MAG: hypothetical protein ACR2LS_09995 [Thermomicrobiales bacterium]
MSSHHVRREQHRFRIIAILALVILILVLTPILLLSDLRLQVGHRLGWVPSAAEQLYSEGESVDLIVLTAESPNPFSGPTRTYTATFIAEWTGTSILLHDLARERTLDLPLTRYDLVSGAADRSALLFVNERAPGGPQAVLVTLASGEVRPLPPGETEPGIPGDWDEEISFGNIRCGGVSPDKTWVACIVHGGTRLLFGDWELVVHPFGRSDEQTRLYRGLGSDPVVGWAPDNSAVYFQNERGVWRSEVPARES